MSLGFAGAPGSRKGGDLCLLGFGSLKSPSRSALGDDGSLGSDVSATLFGDPCWGLDGLQIDTEIRVRPFLN